MKLISMTDFVLEQQWNNNGSPKCDISERHESFKNMIAYANFLKQPLTLGMFVPCDEDGNVLKELIYSDQVHIYLNHYEKKDYVKRCDDYHKAKEKVLFEGFVVLSDEGGIIELECKDVFINYNKEEDLFFLDSWNGDAIIMNIECLANLINHTASNIKLTKSAIKQINL